jgi:hypothetical protein
MTWTTLQAQHMPFPTEEIFKEIVNVFNICWNFPNCFGSIGGKHIRIKCALTSGSQYFNNKQCLSIVLRLLRAQICGLRSIV